MPVTSVFGRIGAVVAAANDYAASLIQNDSSVAGADVKAALNTLLGLIPSVPVSSVFARTGAIVAAAGDYAASKITNDSSVGGSTTKDALNTLMGLTPVAVSSSRAFLASDAGKLLVCDSASTITLTFNTSVMSANDVVYILRKNTGSVTVANGTGTANASNNLKSLAYRYSTGSLWFESASVAYMSGERA
jgi:hypothetical protein